MQPSTKHQAPSTALPDDVVLSVRGVSKKFCRNLRRSMWYGVQDLARNLLGVRPRAEVTSNELQVTSETLPLPVTHHSSLVTPSPSPVTHHSSLPPLRRDEFWALQDINFELKRGEVLGLIGVNGCGKTTLLRLLTGIFPPDAGEISVRGRVGALIALGAGFHPHMTGRENVYLNGTILGMSKAELDANFDEIVNFAEIGDFIEAPVSTYSSGMRVRLGFAIAVNIKPDLLLVDEVLAVGDMGFRAKCYDAMSGLARRAAVVFVSHTMSHISRIATRCMVLNRGRMHYMGTTGEAMLEYQRLFAKSPTDSRTGNGRAFIDEVAFISPAGREKVFLHAGEPLHVRARIRAAQAVGSIVLDVVFRTQGDELAAECNNFVYPKAISLRAGEEKVIDIIIPHLTLNPGVYELAAVLTSANMIEHHDWIRHVATVEVLGDRIATAYQQFIADWAVSETSDVNARE